MKCSSRQTRHRLAVRRADGFRGPGLALGTWVTVAAALIAACLIIAYPPAHAQTDAASLSDAVWLARWHR